MSLSAHSVDIFVFCFFSAPSDSTFRHRVKFLICTDSLSYFIFSRTRFFVCSSTTRPTCPFNIPQRCRSTYNFLNSFLAINIFSFNYGKVKAKFSLCLTEHHSMKAYWGSGCIAPRILDLGTRWRWVVSFTPRPLYSQGRSPGYPLDRRLGGFSGTILCPFSAINVWILICVPRTKYVS
jgi:hypothetical protein